MTHATASLGLILVLGTSGCATQSAGTMSSRQAVPECPSGHTLTCEVRRTARIHHGTFRKNYDRCSCEHDAKAMSDTPVIPGIRQ